LKFLTPNNITMTKYLDVKILCYKTNFITILKYFNTVEVIILHVSSLTLTFFLITLSSLKEF